MAIVYMVVRKMAGDEDSEFSIVPGGGHADLSFEEAVTTMDNLKKHPTSNEYEFSIWSFKKLDELDLVKCVTCQGWGFLKRTKTKGR